MKIKLKVKMKVNIVPTRFDLRLQSKEVLQSEGESENESEHCANQG